MEEKKKPTMFNVFAGCLFSILMLWQAIPIIQLILMDSRMLKYGMYQIPILWLIGLVIVTTGLFSKKRKILTIGFGLLAFIAIKENLSVALSYNHFRENYPDYNILSLLPNLLELIGFLGAFLLAITMLSSTPAKGFWEKTFFVSAICIVASPLVYVLFQLKMRHVILGGYWFGIGVKFYTHLAEYIIRGIICASAIFLFSLWAVYPEKKPVLCSISKTGPSTEENGITQKFCSHCGNEVLPQSVICPKCGCSIAVVSESDIPSTSLNIISFFIPIVGLVLYLVHRDKSPRKAKAIGKFSLIGLCIYLLLVVCANIYINYESPEERARRKINEAMGRLEESRDRLDELQSQHDFIQGLIDSYGN